MEDAEDSCSRSGLLAINHLAGFGLCLGYSPSYPSSELAVEASKGVYSTMTSNGQIFLLVERTEGWVL